MSSESYEIIDTHLHVFDLELRETWPNKNNSYEFPHPENHKVIYKTMSMAEASEVTSKSGINNVVFVQVHDDCPEEARWIHASAQEFPFIKAIVAGLDLTKHEKLEECIQEFKEWNPKSPKFVGVRHLVGNQPFDFLTREDVQTGLGILEKHNVTFDLYVVPGSLCHVAMIAEKFPKLRMVIDHIGKPKVQAGEIEEWKKEISAAAKFPNVFVKLSGMIIEANPWSVEVFQPYVDHCIQEFGIERCMYGSDWPVSRLAEGVDYAEVLQLLKDLIQKRSDEDKKAIFRDNAIKFYSLEDVV